MKSKKILHIIKGLGRGGAERLLVSTIRQHSKQYRFDVVYFLSEKNHLVAELRALDCTVTCLPSTNAVKMLLQLPALVRLIKNNRYEILHAHLPWAGIVARIAGKITKVPVVYTEHNLFNRYNVVTRLVSKLTFGWQATVIAVSVRVAEVLKEEVNPKVPVKVIQNGVDVEEFRKVVGHLPPVIGNGQPATGNLIIGTVTALTAQKRIDRWIKIAEQVAARVPNSYFVIVGDGVLGEEVSQQAKQLLEKNKILIPGQTDDPVSWLAQFDIFLMSSDFEGLPVSLLEAMGMECVPVVTNVGGIPAVVEQGVNGYMYDPKNMEEAVEKIVLLAGDVALRKEIGERARKTVVEKFSVKRMVAELEAVYKNLKS